MNVAERLDQRVVVWKELERSLVLLEDRKLERPSTKEILRLGELYRAACADLMLAESNDLSGETVGYLHALVARAHNAIYRSRGFRPDTWSAMLFSDVPRQLRSDWTLAVAAVAFYGWFLIGGLLGYIRRDFAMTIAGPEAIAQMEMSYSQPVTAMNRSDAMMAGYYIQHNASIGLQCFGSGVIPLIGPLFVMITQGLMLGAMFGHITMLPQAGNFYTFVTSHAPFELTAIVFAGAAGLRMGWGLVEPGTSSRLASLRRSAARALPIVGASVVLFVLAAFLEGFVSASPLPYPLKALIAILSSLAIAAYILLPGRDVPAPGPAPAG
jgi:uncharacterized membrane protein SpoIIM required for sporulation